MEKKDPVYPVVSVNRFALLIFFPIRIYRCFTHDLIDELQRLNPLECIDYGLCSYVCPSKLPLTETLKRCKLKLSGKFNFVTYKKEKGRLILYEKAPLEVNNSVKDTTDTSKR